MSKEQEGHEIPITVTTIHIDLKERIVSFEHEGEEIAKVSFANEGVVFVRGDQESLPASSETGPKAAKESEPRVVLTGRLKTKLREGRPDRNGRPTAYGKFAAHVEGEDQAQMYIATFHRHTTKIALSLPRDVQITVDGYPHESNSPKRLPTFSVINLVDYPGKPKKK